jgi:hypothetical protein
MSSTPPSRELRWLPDASGRDEKPDQAARAGVQASRRRGHGGRLPRNRRHHRRGGRGRRRGRRQERARRGPDRRGSGDRALRDDALRHPDRGGQAARACGLRQAARTESAREKAADSKLTALAKSNINRKAAYRHAGGFASAVPAGAGLRSRHIALEKSRQAAPGSKAATRPHSDRHIRLDIRRMARPVLSRRDPGKGLAQVLRRAVCDHRNQRLFLSHTITGSRASLAGRQGLRVLLEGVEVHYPLEAPRTGLRELDRRWSPIIRRPPAS